MGFFVLEYKLDPSLGIHGSVHFPASNFEVDQ